jgi:ELWxxDGT repeat protein
MKSNDLSRETRAKYGITNRKGHSHADMSQPYRIKIYSNLEELTAFRRQLFFFAADGISGTELWVSNGSTTGTRLVKDLLPGREDGSPILGMIASSDKIFFPAYLPGMGLELCVSDGTTIGTRVLTQNSMITWFEGFAVVGSSLFVVKDGELWLTDGTSAGTRLVKDLTPGFDGSDIHKLTRVGNNVFFLASPGSGEEVWISDGSSTGTRRVTSEVNFFSIGEEFVALGNALVFSAASWGDSAGREIWISDGTAGGTRRLADINTHTYGSSNPRNLTVVGNKLFFTADDGQRGYELWITDGTTAGTRLVKDITPGEGDTWISFPTAVGDRLFFVADDGQRGHELWVSDGTSEGTKLVRDLQPGVGSILKAPKDLIGVGDTLFFSFDEPGTGRELWRSDGTAAGTKRVADINPGPFSSKISSLTLAGNRLYFAAESINLIETELWALDVSADLNEPPMTTLDIAAVAASKAEGHTGLTPFTFRINRSGDTTGTSSVRWSTAGTGSSPTNAADFNGGILPSGTVTFAAGETSKTLTVNVKGDSALEAVETFRLSLFSPLGATLSPTAAAASGTILNDDSLLSIAPLAAITKEGNAGSTTRFTFTVTRSGHTTGTSTALWRVSNPGTNAASAADFTSGVLPSGAVSFAPGQTSRTLIIPVSGDSRKESDETFLLTLSAPSPGTSISSTAASARGTILNDDVSPMLTVAAKTASRKEGHGGATPFTFLLSRTGGTTGTSSVRWSTAGTGSSPANAADFNGGILPSGTVTFAPGETSKTLTVNVKGDRALEAVETFRLSLFSPLGATLSPTAAAASGTILNDDGLVSIAANSPLLQDSAKSMGVLPAANVNPPADLVNRWLSSPSPIAPLMNPSLEVFGGGLSVDLPFAGLNSPPQ